MTLGPHGSSCKRKAKNKSFHKSTETRRDAVHNAVTRVGLDPSEMDPVNIVQMDSLVSGPRLRMLLFHHLKNFEGAFFESSRRCGNDQGTATEAGDIYTSKREWQRVVI